MIFYLNLYKTLMGLNFSALASYRANFFNSLLSSFLWGGFQIVSIIFLTSSVTSAYGWTKGELVFLVMVYNLVLGFFHMLFSRNFERLAEIVSLGQMDTILTKPADSQFLVSLWLVNFTSLFRVILTLALLPVLVPIFKIDINYFYLSLSVFILPVGLLVLYSVWSIIMTFVIWFPRLSNLVELLYTINGQGKFPKEMYTTAKNILLYLFVPFALVSTVPAKLILNKFSLEDLIQLLFLAIVLFLTSRLFWKFALRSYTSASS